MKNLKFYIVLFVWVLNLPSAFAQKYNDDAKLWLYVKIDKDITSKFNVQLALQSRLENNISELGQLNSKLELTYKLNKNIRAVAAYGFGENRRLDGSYGDRQQFYAGVILRKKIKSFLFAYRNVLQAQVKNINTSETGGVPLFFDRNRINIKYELNKWLDVYAEEEINLSYGQFKYDNISRSRTSLGAIYNISKKSNVEAYFMFQKHFRYNNQPRRDFIYGLTYSYSF